MSAAKPKVLFVYYTYSQQTRSVVEAMADVLRRVVRNDHYAGAKHVTGLLPSMRSRWTNTAGVECRSLQAGFGFLVLENAEFDSSSLSHSSLI